MNKPLQRWALTVAALTTIAISPLGVAAESKLWAQFKKAKEDGKETTLPDFSYAGYKYSAEPLPDTSGWKVFKARDYGAIPNDGRFDDRGIQAAIDAAEKNGNGIVLFEKGRYKISPNENTGDGDRITVQGSNIVLRGQGFGKNGTNIFMDKKKVKGFGWPMIVVGAGGRERFIRNVTKLEGNARRETFKIEVADASSLKENQKIMLWTASRELRDDLLGGRAIGNEWEYIRDNGVDVREIHTVKSIRGKTVTLKEPLHISLKESYDVDVRAIGMIENVGIESIRFTGNWPSYGEDFIHHKPGDPVHDYGWHAMQLEFIQNSWVTDVEFRDFNQNLFIKSASAITVSNVKITGKKAHTSLSVTQSYGVLVKDSEDTAGHVHGAGIAQRNSGGVYLRHKLKEGQQVDSHALGPYASLFDNVSNGNIHGNGGAHRHFPHHLGYWVGWNFKMVGGKNSYNFWQTSKRGATTYLQPYFIGLHGKKVSFAKGTYAVNESQGKRVEPYSLFEAQLGLRTLPGYKLCCKEGSEKTFDSPVDIAFGAQGKYNFKRNFTGKIKLNVANFGDPVPGHVKSVYYRPAANRPAASRPATSSTPEGPHGFTFEANEGATVSASRLRNVAYGANGDFTVRYNRQAAIDCTNDAFGKDPAPGVKKACFSKLINVPSGYSEAATEGQTIAIRGTVNVAFGTEGQFIWKTGLTSNIACTRQAFGGDPKPGVAKKCYMRVVESSNSSSNSSSSNSTSSSTSSSSNSTSSNNRSSNKNSSSSSRSSSCNGTRNVAQGSRVELDLSSANCVTFASNLSGRSLQVWDSDRNKSCNFRGTVTSQGDSGRLTVDENYEISTSFSGRTVKFNPSNGCRYVQVRYF